MERAAANRHVELSINARQMCIHISRTVHCANGSRWFCFASSGGGSQRGIKRPAAWLSYDGRGPKIFRELYNPWNRFVGGERRACMHVPEPRLYIRGEPFKREPIRTRSKLWIKIVVKINCVSEVMIGMDESSGNARCNYRWSFFVRE